MPPIRMTRRPGLSRPLARCRCRTGPKPSPARRDPRGITLPRSVMTRGSCPVRTTRRQGHQTAPESATPVTPGRNRHAARSRPGSPTRREGEGRGSRRDLLFPAAGEWGAADDGTHPTGDTPLTPAPIRARDGCRLSRPGGTGTLVMTGMGRQWRGEGGRVFDDDDGVELQGPLDEAPGRGSLLATRWLSPDGVDGRGF